MQNYWEKSLLVNEAGLIVESVSNFSLWTQTSECCQFKFSRLLPIEVIDASFYFKFDSQSKWVLELRNENNTTINRVDDFIFDEHSIYGWNYSIHNPPYCIKSANDHLITLCIAVTALITILLLSRIFYWSISHLNSFPVLRIWLSPYEEIENDLGSLDEAIDLIANSPNNANRECRHRVRALDVFRGITICCVIFVNYGGGEYWFMKYSYWNGLTFADLLFPWFVWIMGAGLAIDVKSILRDSIPRKTLLLKMAYRSLSLVFLGVVITNLGNNDLEKLRFMGILQRLGIVYFIVGVLETTFMLPQTETQNSNDKYLDLIESWKQWIIVIVLVVIHTLVTFFLPVSNCPIGYLGLDDSMNKYCTGGAAGYIDRLIFTKYHIYAEPTSVNNCKRAYDPEGSLGTLTTVLCMYLGVHAAKILQVYKSIGERLVRWFVYGIIAICIAILLDNTVIPINRNLWSLSYVLICAGLAFVLFSLLYVVVDKNKLWKGSPFYQAGMNSLVVYVGQIVFKDSFPWQWKSLFPHSHEEYLIMDLWGTLLWTVIAVILYKKRTIILL